MNTMSFLYMSILAFVIGTVSLCAQTGEGDQFLDGIGETALIARYRFNGDLQDRSRNQYHASLQGRQAAFVEDQRFGKVLSLPGGNSGAYVQIPSRALIEVESLSITGWIYLQDSTGCKVFFDLRHSQDRYFYCTAADNERSNGCRTRITAAGHEREQGPSTFGIMAGQWVHLAAVLDASKRTLGLYIDGKCVGQSAGVTASLAQILHQNNDPVGFLTLGKSANDTESNLCGKLFDVRIYSIPLNDQQVAGIHRNAGSMRDPVTGEEKAAKQDAIQSQDTARLLTRGLICVPDIAVQTTVGELPHLPSSLRGIYRDKADGPPVRVIWPSPTDNQDVAQTGTYTLSGFVPGTEFQPTVAVTVQAQSAAVLPQPRLKPFPLGQVVLNPDTDKHDTQYMKNRDKFILALAKTDPNAFLYNFRDAFGQRQPADVRPLRGWDSQTTRLRGHTSGHYLSALAQVCAGATYDAALRAEFSRKMDYMIDVLYDLSEKSGKPETPGGPCNADPTTIPPGPGKKGYDSDLSREGIRTDYWNWGQGYISAYPPDQFIMLEQGATYGGNNNQIWAPYYTLHKILAGLMDCYEVAGNPKALEIARNMGIWVYRRLQAVPTETRIRMWNRYIAGEYGGMNEAMARLYRITEDGRFLECARLFDNIDLFFGNSAHAHGLAANVDTIRGKHANQHIPQIIGALETYKGTGDIAYYRVAANFWEICAHCYMYCIGGVAGARNPNNAECFTAQPNTLFQNGFSPGGQNETCATYNLLKLSRQLFFFNPDAKYMDYYEQAMYNHILASVDENNPGNTYHVPLNPGARKSFGNARMDGFTCCNGTALESHTKLQDSIYFSGVDDDALYVNLFIPSTLDWRQKKVTVTQKTRFPYSDSSLLTIAGGGTFAIHIRVPGWTTPNFAVRINDQSQSVKAIPGTYLVFRRDWSDGDTIELKIPMDFHLCPVMDQPNIAGIFYGPVLLAAEEPESRSTWRKITLNPEDLRKSFTGDPASLRFAAQGLNFRPFFETYGRYSVYFDISIP